MALDKRELKRAYRETPRPMGVYQILNTVNGKRYVGSSLDLEGIRNRLWFGLGMGSDSFRRELQADWKTYGEEAFCFEVLEYLKPDGDPTRDYREELAIMEELWLEKLQPYGEKGYNKPR